ncbi:MAG TPA: LysR family transcriptional regulator [Chthoniobacteraceae bacterium]|nr:LysR family transcriptional regulator [Chthoniobacteraceae bacterium]
MISRLRSFLVVLKEGSLNRAAARLRMSQPALSRQIQALENEVGGRLLERSTAGVRPTDAGHLLARRAETLIADYEAAFAEARRLAQGEKSELRIGYLASTAQSLLDPALIAFRKRHPEVKVRLLDLSPGEQIDALRRGEIDIALIGQEGEIASHDFYTRKLITLPVIAILPAAHPLASRREINLDELSAERFVSAPEDDMPGRDRWVARLCRKAGFHARFTHPAKSLQQKLSLIANENAVTLEPAYLRHFPTAGVSMVALADPGATWDFLVVWQRGRTAGPTHALLEALSAAAARSCAAAEGIAS